MNILDFKGDKFLINFDFENRIEYFYSPTYYYVNDIYSGYYDLKDITSNFTEREMKEIKEQEEENMTSSYYDMEGNLKTKYPRDMGYILYKKDNKTGVLKKIFKFIDYLPYYGWEYNMREEQFGLYLIRFLNTDFSNFESAFNGFLKYYGFSVFAFKGESSILEKKEYVGEDFLSEISKIYNYNKKDLIYIQEKYKEIVNYIYFDERYKKYSNYYKLYTYTLFYDLSKYVLNPKNLYIISDEENRVFFYPDDDRELLYYPQALTYFSERYEDDPLGSVGNLSVKFDRLKDSDNYVEDNNLCITIYFDELLKRVEKEKRLEKIKSPKFYASNNFSTLLFVVLREFVEHSSLPIKKCENCGKYFIPSIRNSEKYCQFIYKDGKTCREIAPEITFANNTESVNYIYRKIYKRKYNETKTKHQNEQIQKNFEKWKKNAKEKMKEYKKGKISEKTILEWLEKNN